MVASDNKYYKMMLNELDTISSLEISQFGHYLLNRIPDYFFSVPASSSGRYHPIGDLGEGGLVRHSIAVKKMLEHLFEPEGYYEFTDREKDLLRLAALFHDSFKSGTQEMYEQDIHTKHLHPVYAAQFVVMSSIMAEFDYKDACFIADAIISHMGQWNKKLRNSGILPKPITAAQKVLHLADYLASRKDVNVDVGDDYVYDPGKEDEVPESNIVAAVTINEKGE